MPVVADAAVALMVTFTIDSNFTHVDCPELIRQALDRYFVIKKDGFVQGIDFEEYRATKKVVIKTKYHPETIMLYNYQTQQFPSGRVGYVLDWCRENRVPCQVVDVRRKPERHLDIAYVGPPSDGSNGKPARPYQLRAALVLRSRGGRGILWHATASGKTVTAARMISDFGVNTLYLVPSIELLDQTAAALTEFLRLPRCQHVGRIGEGQWDVQPITVATTQTLWARFETEPCKQLLAQTEFLIGDECHHVNSADRGKTTKDGKGEAHSVNSWYILALHCPAYYRAGLTGTPGKDLEQKRSFLELAFGRVADRVSARELIDAGIISDVEIHVHDIKYSRTFPDFPTARKEGILLNEQFNEYIVAIATAELKMGRSVLMLTDSKAHQGPMLERLFARQGMTVPFISGDSTGKSRKNVREDFKSGKLRALIGTVYKEGVDFPALDTGILCGGGKDEKKPIQFLGRVLRKAKGKDIAHLHDFNFRDKRWLQQHSRLRLSYMLEEELDKIIKHEGITI